MKNSRRITLSENEMPRQWYNIIPDMPNKPLPPLHPVTRQPAGPQDLAAIFPMELIKQEMSNERYIDIPDEVLDFYMTYRPSPVFRAESLEKSIGTKSKIFYKYEGYNYSGSHKANTAIAQAYYNKKEGIRRITTETGAGQWGSAMSFACNHFGLELLVFMVKVSYNQKPGRKIMMNAYNAKVVPSPSTMTIAGRKILEQDPDSPGSLGIAISEAIEVAVQDPYTKYSLGSVLNHVILHQTIIGQEALLQMEKAGYYPDVVIGCFGGGSNFSGIAFPFLREKLVNGKDIRLVAVEPASCPKLTKGKFMYDFGDSAGLTPLLPMYTIGHNFIPEKIHAGGLRYHGAGVLVSQLVKDGFIEPKSKLQRECFEAGVLFARCEGILPAPESNYAIAAALDEARKADLEGTSKTILFNLSGHGHLDISAYEKYFEGNLPDHELSNEEAEKILQGLKDLPD
ncbi:MAG TPA: TrpB-like pyridoxal phosphate-dependent enzyme [Bacteroidales bacterium]|nr:TrpB-like pyridoxal phosphate-dependent enzyme [Bacteroidales bacterium]HCI55784.1 TrpB-like pyridoxal phosphate-dependent enzyme [Bacteroidales bacterium]HOU96735.1 TrpB-like pyridoxal phosphate-dependent enzyme [Bacteroidales bacterium]HQG37353.1 TrpB-like pyridoxal phosphate-dependent enzyme [Bacteroidales bacterium]HQG53750.1 TrpB-like pyridoxal phosphate-dependent enzyme [Bacteroidales bacterium]